MDHGGEATDKEYNKGRKCFEGTSHFEPLQLKFHLLLNPGAFPNAPGFFFVRLFKIFPYVKVCANLNPI